MTDDNEEIISSGNPHEVHLPEGSHTAVHKTAVPMEPSIRNTIANPDEEEELVAIVAGVSQSPETPAREAHVPAQADAPDRLVSAPEQDLEEHRVSAAAQAAHEHSVDAPADAAHSAESSPPVPLAQVMGELPSLELGSTVASSASTDESPAAAQEAPAEADTSDKAAEVAAAAAYMEEMNFPARVVKLKIANDQIRGQIEKLEKPLFPPVPVEAPAAVKGKDKEPAKKPAKGH